MNNPWAERPDIRPKFMDGTAFCSCYTSTTGQPVGNCPQWVKLGNKTCWCRIGAGVQQGGNGGKICVPYLREMTFANLILDRLVAMARASDKQDDEEHLAWVELE